MWLLCAVCAVVLLPPSCAENAACDDGQFNIQLDLPDDRAYLCTGDYIPLPKQVLPSVAIRYKPENSYHACMDTAIEYTAAIPNSGAHRPILAKYGQYIYCPPQRWVHNLQHAGVAFLYHPCTHSYLKEAFFLVARSCTPNHIITPLPTLSRERPIALAAWCSTLEMSHINVTEIRDWLRENHEHRYDAEVDVSYQHLLIRPSLVASGNTSICSERTLRLLNRSSNHGTRLKMYILSKRRRRAALPFISGVHDVVLSDASTSTFSATLSGIPTEPGTKNQANLSFVAITGDHPSPNPVTPLPPKDTDLGDSIAGIHSRETKVPELPVETNVSNIRNISKSLLDPNLAHSIGNNSSEEKDHNEKSATPPVTQLVSPESPPNKKSISLVTGFPASTKPPDKLTDQKHLSTIAEKPECTCRQDSTPQSPAKVLRRLGAGQQKNSDVFVSTPRTEEATWAAASLIFLLALLTFSVLYTQIYKKFRKSQSLYWASGSNSEETETVASIIKRRLVQGHSKRKKWIGRKKSPARLYESLSESSD